jgi:hypothetical protein
MSHQPKPIYEFGPYRLNAAERLLRKIERLASLKDFRMASGVFGAWVGWTPDDQPLMLRDVGTQDIYALEWQTPLIGGISKQR